MAEDRIFTAEMPWRILDVTRKLTTPVEFDDVLMMVVDVARDVLSAERGTVFLFYKKNMELFAEVGTEFEVEEIRFLSLEYCSLSAGSAVPSVNRMKDRRRFLLLNVQLLCKRAVLLREYMVKRNTS